MPGQVPEMGTVISQEQADRLCDEMDVWTERHIAEIDEYQLPYGLEWYLDLRIEGLASSLDL